MAHSPRHSLSGGDSMQKYMLLSSQQEVLRRRLSLQIPTASPMTASSPEFQSLSSSPTFSRPAYASSWSAEPEYIATHPLSAYPIPTQPGMGHRNSVDESLTEDSHRLYEINQQIKATLTELLNTESVRSDEKYRAWIQGRLMDAEQQMRRQRRRRSSVDREIAESIAEHFEHPFP
ncbi:uncharacterized protein BDR25DRAFT_299760 [Lindgomyces ingoldianus]|uniref:Uncharacterized protein n=1 Tax=Lindgomyces ingoldianus TaxID=673940 RepID=A0ACB6RHU7_9PLEO|nr:uncharacterized protein BDR25DRAFT_299760 [Lindgomyces ingoldianus]KAF2478041.1 hypothetical protein BDR25DRAFT_299760 [Lindgomyces ingoldianus]